MANNIKINTSKDKLLTDYAIGMLEDFYMLENEKSFHSLKDLVKNNKIKKIYLENFYTYNLVILNK